MKLIFSNMEDLMKPFQTLTILVLAASGLLSACSGNPTAEPKPSVPNAATIAYPAPSAPSNSQPTAYPVSVLNQAQASMPEYPAPGQDLKITAADGSTKTVVGTALMALTKIKVNLNGNDIEVRKLTDVLNAAGINTFTKVSVNGANGTLALTKDQAAQSYLDISADGNIQLDVQGMPVDKWINGVQTIKID